MARSENEGRAAPGAATKAGEGVVVDRKAEVALFDAPADNDRLKDARVARAACAMSARLEGPWTVASLAKVAGLSRAAFARRFVAEHGLSPLRYLAALRVGRARSLLVETDRALAWIASHVGYESEFAFNRAFKRHTGEPPGTFRRRVRSGGSSSTPPVRAAA